MHNWNQTLAILVIVLVLGGMGYLLAQAAERHMNSDDTSGSGQGIAPHDSGIRGTVFLGPMCPVMRDPPDPLCADKRFATTVAVSRAGSTSMYVSTKSDENGTFEFSLPPGDYTVTATGNSAISRCSSSEIIVSARVYATTTISCDTGIR